MTSAIVTLAIILMILDVSIAVAGFLWARSCAKEEENKMEARRIRRRNWERTYLDRYDSIYEMDSYRTQNVIDVSTTRR